MGKGAMDRWLDRMTKFLPDKWEIRIVVICSLAAHLVLALFAEIRRRKAFSWRRLFLWLAYQLAGWAPTYALAHLSVGSTSREQQLVAFWAPFLLYHLGGPDNIGAYSLEDNILSWRGVLKDVMQVTVAIFVPYKHIYVGGGGGALLLASTIMLAVGVAKYVERAFALRRGDLGSIRSSSKKQQPRRSTERVCIGRGRELDNEGALLFAHNQIDFWRRAMVDSSGDRTKHDTSRKILSLEWKDMCKVAEMELSLMYDILYSKAAMVHTWGGYFIRLVSPLATAAAFLLFYLYNKERQRRPDIIITYALLVSAFLLDLRWLLRALVSTWTHAFLDARPRCWLHHAFLCTGRWRRLRRSVVSLDPGRLLLLRAPSSSYRMWSGTIGQYNLLHECTRDTTSLCSRLAKHVGLEDGWNEYHYSEGLEISDDVKGLVFGRIQQVLKSTYSTDVDVDITIHVPSSTLPCACSMEDITTSWGHIPSSTLPCVCSMEDITTSCGQAATDVDEEIPSSTLPRAYSMEDITTSWGQAAASRRGQKLKDFVLAFGREFQEDVLVWHIGTQVFLLCCDQQLIKGKIAGMMSSIKALSEYLMFLVAVRPNMLPGLVLGSLYEVTGDALKDVWNKGKDRPSCSTTREEKLARILRNKKDADSEWGLDDEKTCLVSDAADLALELLQADQSNMPELLELVFNVWVDKLLYAGTRCSRDSHAKQLSRGGELTTIAWIMAEHAGPFRIGQFRDKTRVPKPEEEKINEFEDCRVGPVCGAPPGYGGGSVYETPPDGPVCGVPPRVPEEAEEKKKKEGTTTDDKPKEARKDTREKTRRYATLYPAD